MIAASITAAPSPAAIPSLVSTQQEAQKEATTGVQDGDEPMGGGRAGYHPVAGNNVDERA
jgi:hypothetical protein